MFLWDTNCASKEREREREKKKKYHPLQPTITKNFSKNVAESCMLHNCAFSQKHWTTEKE